METATPQVGHRVVPGSRFSPQVEQRMVVGSPVEGRLLQELLTRSPVGRFMASLKADHKELEAHGSLGWPTHQPAGTQHKAAAGRWTNDEIVWGRRP